jgi:pimeloyl-ACP methyl ester carboxylesterase
MSFTNLPALTRSNPARPARASSGARGISIVLAALALGGCGATHGTATAAAVEAGSALSSSDIDVNGTTLHVARAGQGPALILLHGFPQDSTVYRRIAPRLAERFSVVVPDLRGIGASATATTGFDAPNVAEDIRQLSERLGLERPFVVGHDLGGIVAYSLARAHPDAVRGVMLIDAPVPGLDPWDALECELWHMGFFMTPRLPEQLLAGRELAFVREFTRGALQRPEAIDEAAAERYAAAYTGEERLGAGLGYYRAFPAAKADNRARRDPTDLPLVLVGSDHGFAAQLPTLSAALAEHGWRNVTERVVERAGHYVLDDQPDAVSALIEELAGG